MKVSQFRARGRAADQRRESINSPRTEATVHRGAYRAINRLHGIGFTEIHGWLITHHSPACVTLSHVGAPLDRRLLVFCTTVGDPYFLHDGQAYAINDDSFTLILARLNILHYKRAQ